jgi:hypothetical protein
MMKGQVFPSIIELYLLTSSTMSSLPVHHFEYFAGLFFLSCLRNDVWWHVIFITCLSNSLGQSEGLSSIRHAASW